MLAPASVRSRKIESGRIGWATRVSITTNETSRIADAANSPSVRADSHECVVVPTSPYTSSTRPSVTVTAPATSKRRSSLSTRLSCSSTGASTITITAIGTLMKKIHSQPTVSVSTPPRSTPTAAPLPAIAPHTPSAVLRSLPSANVVVRIERAAGEMIAAPRPWTARAATSVPVEFESPHANDAAANTISPTMKIRRRPNRSATRPPSSRNPPNVNAYALATHCRPDGEKCSERSIDGSATFTIDTSRITMNCDAQSSASASHFAREITSDAGPPGATATGSRVGLAAIRDALAIRSRCRAGSTP